MENLGSIMLLIDQAIQLIQKEYNPIAKDIRQPCNYCGYRYYVLCVKQ
ncbi:hypothetical protein MNBD_CHLOROFLEXI01-3574 [hydrothermal vent metagenome]|uniref:Uncharacterized protein n=1 Tax=hydrothermal vent metagenome TaxID=652676 RepID=A0A3B0V1X7_9ZZZZ